MTDVYSAGSTDRRISSTQLQSDVIETSTFDHVLDSWKPDDRLMIHLPLVQKACSPDLSLVLPFQYPLCVIMEDHAPITVDAMAQMVLAREGGLMKAMIAFENDETLAAPLITADPGIPAIHSGAAGIRQDESAPMDVDPGEARQ
ncbi:MAG: hypothetical protein ACKPKO_15850, partial [Candidatus Fonsibacter sp.]